MTFVEMARMVWGNDTEDRHLMCIGPLGSRTTNNYVIFNRRLGRIQTGWLGSKSCFEGDLDSFEAKVESDYGSKVTNGAQLAVRRREEYRQVIAFLRSLPALEATGVPESGLSPADLGVAV